MTRYVLGFAFDDAGENVVLIKKTKPAWQAGKYNGVGGKIEGSEGAVEAMIREFFEEAGFMTLCDNWTYFAEMRGPEWECDCFHLFNNHVYRNVTSQTEEKICTFSVQTLPETISNVPWLIAAARNNQKNGGEFTLEVKYS